VLLSGTAASKKTARGSKRVGIKYPDLMEKSVSKESTFTTTDGEKIAYHIDDFSDPWDERRTMVLMHPLMGHSRRYHSMVPRLTRYFRVVRMDLRGHGGSSLPDTAKPLDLARLTADMQELLDHLELPAVHVVGNSAGGYLSQRLAIEHPERVISLCLFGSTPGLAKSHAASWLPRIANEGLRNFLKDTIADRFPLDREDPRKIEWFLDECAKNDDHFIIRCIDHFTKLDWSNDLGRIRCPTLIVAGGNETVGEADAYRDMSARIPGSTLIYYRGLPHNICDIAPDRCADDVIHFLRWNFSELDHLR
jgi:3-oxoadipate enol-lactonase